MPPEKRRGVTAEASLPPLPKNKDPLPDRLMVGLRFLVPCIGVRVPVRQQSCETDRGLQRSYIYQRLFRTSHGLELS